MWRLADAIVKGDRALVRRLVEVDQVDINGDDYDGFAPPSCNIYVRHVRVPLIIAQLRGQDEIVRYLIKKGARINQPMWATQETILHKAVERGNLSMVRYLLEHPDLEVDLFDYQEATPLLRAVDYGRAEMIGGLVGRGAEVEEALIIAIRLGNKRVIREFLIAGADPEQIGDNGRPLIYMAAKWGHTSVVELLLSYGYADDASRKNCPALSAAAEQGHFDIVKALIESGWNPDGEESDIRVPPPLHGALHSGRKTIVTYLLQQKANVNLIDAEGIPAVFYAAELGDVEILKAFEFLGADLSVVANDMTAIRSAVLYSNREAIEFFMDDTRMTPDVNQRDSKGHSLLHIAVGKGDFATFCLLEKNGAVPDPGLDCTSRMFSAHHPGFFEKMLEHCPDLDRQDCIGWTPLTWAANWGHSDTVVKLIEKGADVEGTTFNGQTALHKAVMNGFHHVVSALLARGADPNARDYYGETPLHLAAVDGRKYETHLLLVFGAMSNASLTEEGGSALRFSAIHGHETMIRKLIEAGADVRIKNKSGQTPIDFAVAKGHKQMAIDLRRALSLTADDTLQITISEN